MTQTTLFSDRQLFVSFYKNSLSRIKGVGILYGIILFTTFPMFYFLNIGEALRRIEEYGSYSGFSGHLEVYPISIVFFFLFAAAAVISLSAIANSYMHSKKAVDVFHALPVKRPTMLLANFAAVVTVMFAIEAFCYLTVGVVSAFTIPVAPAALFIEFLRVFILTVTIAAVAAFCAVCANNILDSGIFTLAFCFIVPCYTVLIMLLLDNYVAGFDFNTDILLQSLKFSPICMLFQTFFDEDAAWRFLPNLKYLPVSAVLLAASCGIYVRRKSETAQSNKTDNVIYRFVLMAASIGGGAFFGYAVGALFGWSGYNRSFVSLLTVSCLFTVTTFLVLNTVTTRKVNPGVKGACWLAAGVIITAGLYISVDRGFFGMESYIPQVENVTGVKIYFADEYENVRYYIPDENGGYKYYYGGGKGVVLSEPSEIKIVTDMHKKVVDNIGDEEIYGYVHMEYTLDNGKTVSRRYYDYVPDSVIQNYMQIADLESFKRQTAPVLMSPASDLNYFEIKDGYGRNTQKLDLSDEDKQLLYNAIAQDVLNRTSQMKQQTDSIYLAKINFRYKKIDNPVPTSSGVDMVEYTYAYKSGKYDNTDELYMGYCYEVTGDSINTIKVLNQLGLTQYTNPQQPENIKVVISPDVYNINATRNFFMTGNVFDNYDIAYEIGWNAEKTVYTDAQQIAQIIDSCTSTVYAPNGDPKGYERKKLMWLAIIDADADINSSEANDSNCACYYMSYEKAPQFVKDNYSGYYK